MSIKKAIHTKLIFSVFLLTLLSLVCADVKCIIVDSIFETNDYFNDTNLEQDKKYFILIEAGDDSISLSESEIELELEIEYFSVFVENTNFFIRNLDLRPTFHSTENFISKHRIHLYDLFCDWKFDLF